MVQEVFGASSYPGTLPAAPTPPTTAANALSAGASVFNLETLVIIVAGDAIVTTNFSGATVQRR